jgi:hypothetical protein
MRKILFHLHKNDSKIRSDNFSYVLDVFQIICCHVPCDVRNLQVFGFKNELVYHLLTQLPTFLFGL